MVLPDGTENCERSRGVGSVTEDVGIKSESGLVEVEWFRELGNEAEVTLERGSGVFSAPSPAAHDNASCGFNSSPLSEKRSSWSRSHICTCFLRLRQLNVAAMMTAITLTPPAMPPIIAPSDLLYKMQLISLGFQLVHDIAYWGCWETEEGELVAEGEELKAGGEEGVSFTIA
jgi:hypothetical protein